MPSESVIRKKAIEILNNNGWVTWHPARARFKQNDVFGIIDLLAAKKRSLKKIQLTTVANISTKRKKIINFLKENKIQMAIEIWAWSQKEKKFRKEKINLT
ncbi:MAG: hypothetical protein ACPLW9_01820 [Minisyncoccales bacterium]